MKKLFLLAVSMFIGLSAVAAPLKLLVFGDSLSAGHNLDAKDSFCMQLKNVLTEKGYEIEVLSHSKSGETSLGGSKRIRSALAKRPDGVILQLGINDAFRQVPVEKIKANLQKLISGFKKAGIPVFLVGMEAPMDMPQEYRDAFRKMYTDLALENELLLYPFFMNGLWKEDGTHVSEEYFLKDKIHPSAKGVKIMVKNILLGVEQFISEDVANVEVKK